MFVVFSLSLLSYSSSSVLLVVVLDNVGAFAKLCFRLLTGFIHSGLRFSRYQTCKLFTPYCSLHFHFCFLFSESCFFGAAFFVVVIYRLEGLSLGEAIDIILTLGFGFGDVFLMGGLFLQRGLGWGGPSPHQTAPLLVPFPSCLAFCKSQVHGRFCKKERDRRGGERERERERESE